MPITDDISKSYAKVDVYDAADEAKYRVKRSGLNFVARRGSEFVGSAVESGAEIFGAAITGTVGNFLEFVVGPELARNLGAIAGAIGGNIAGIASIGLAAAVSAGFTEMDYHHQKRNIRELYKDELAARLHKPASQVTVGDMEEVARDNRILAEQLSRARRQRNFGIPLAIAATLATFAMVTMALPALMTALSLPALAGIGGFAVKAAVSMMTYYAVKTPLQSMGNKLFGLMEETANDRIAHIKRTHERGIEIAPEQVLSVFTKANTRLDTLIAEQFGAHYDSMTPEGQQRALEYVRDLVPVEQLARDINSGRIRATELVFAATGQISGAAPNPAAMDEPGVAPELQVAQQVSANFQTRLGVARASAASFAERVKQADLNEAAPTI